MHNRDKSLCYRIFGKPANLEEALDKARNKGNSASIIVLGRLFETGRVYSVAILSGRANPFIYTTHHRGRGDSYQSQYERTLVKARALEKWLNNQGVTTTFQDKCKRRGN